jgi:hypothetical protein
VQLAVPNGEIVFWRAEARTGWAVTFPMCAVVALAEVKLVVLNIALQLTFK